MKEYWALIDFSEDQLNDRLSEYQHYYNWDRLRGSLGKTPVGQVVELSHNTPFWYQVEEDHDVSKEFIHEQSYAKDVRLLFNSQDII